MKRRTKFSLEPKYILLVLSIFCLLLMIFSFKFKNTFMPVRSIVIDTITPMQKGINNVGAFFSEKKKIFTSMQALMKENETLQQELDNVNYDNKILQQEKYELNNLRELYKLDQKYPSYPKVAARVISKDSNNWYNVFTIDKGSDDGLAVDMNVIAGNGLVGIITEVGHNYAKVRSIIDDSSNVSGMFLKTSDTCIVSGNLKLIDKGLLEVSYIKNMDADIKDGYEVVTSQLSDKFLQGILIGYVKNITEDSSKTSKSGYLTPAVDFDKLETVLVITQLKEALH